MAKFNETIPNILKRLSTLFRAWGMIDEEYHGHIIISFEKGVAKIIKREENFK